MKKINWSGLKFPPINLWSAPNQQLLNEITELREKADYFVESNTYLIQAINDLKATIDYSRERFVSISELIKEREFLYYLRSGRFPK